jgi:OOP family OmpA-OmpF porin
MTKILPLALAAATLLAGPVHAQSTGSATGTASGATTPAWPSLGTLYVHAGVGAAIHDIDGGGIDRQLGDLGFAGASTSVNDDETGWRVGAGWQALPWLALELSYFDLGNPGFSSTALRPGTFEARGEVTGWSLDLVPQYQIGTTGFGVFGRLGYARTETKARFTGSGAFTLREESVTARNDSWDAGLGVSYAFNRNFSVRGEWTRYMDLGDERMGGEFDADLFSVSVVYRFQ